jgi:N-acetylmuramoyl-L-alanine amidase
VTVIVLALLATFVGFGRLAHPARADMPSHAGTASSPLREGRAVDASYFASGACELFAPTSGDRHLVVFLDAGHGGIDPGGTGVTEAGQNISESTLTLPVELDTMAILRAQGFTVVASRTTDTTVVRLQPDDVADGALTLKGAHDDVAARAVCANMAGASVLIGIYFDAGSSPANAGSVTGYDQDRPFSAENLRLAQLVQSEVLFAMNSHGWGIPDEGALPDTGLGSYQAPSSGTSDVASAAVSYDHLMLLGPAQAGFFTTPSTMPGALIEPLFLTDPFEGSLADSASGQQTIALGIATAVEQYFAPAPSATKSG